MVYLVEFILDEVFHNCVALMLWSSVSFSYDPVFVFLLLLHIVERICSVLSVLLNQEIIWTRCTACHACVCVYSFLVSVSFVIFVLNYVFVTLTTFTVELVFCLSMLYSVCYRFLALKSGTGSKPAFSRSRLVIYKATVAFEVKASKWRDSKL